MFRFFYRLILQIILHSSLYYRVKFSYKLYLFVKMVNKRHFLKIINQKLLKFKTVICTIVYSRTWYIWWKKIFCQFPYLESLPSSIVISLCLLMLCIPPEGAFCSCTPSYCSCCQIFDRFL